ncbi:hypothetical protein J437_LFUL017770 [Ladona fulva]|uniref:Uncharacterized protein n=1 Tax=Ladona fulva TaxID=123851 RepID=A0A8K0KSX0_LADFU|nr:hypothetical protein J437_LFUL017770 [Ladona fulva]
MRAVHPEGGPPLGCCTPAPLGHPPEPPPPEPPEPPPTPPCPTPLLPGAPTPDPMTPPPPTVGLGPPPHVEEAGMAERVPVFGPPVLEQQTPGLPPELMGIPLPMPIVPPTPIPKEVPPIPAIPPQPLIPLPPLPPLPNSSNGLELPTHPPLEAKLPSST